MLKRRSSDLIEINPIGWRWHGSGNGNRGGLRFGSTIWIDWIEAANSQNHRVIHFVNGLIIAPLKHRIEWKKERNRNYHVCDKFRIRNLFIKCVRIYIIYLQYFSHEDLVKIISLIGWTRAYLHILFNSDNPAGRKSGFDSQNCRWQFLSSERKMTWQGNNRARYS